MHSSTMGKEMFSIKVLEKSSHTYVGAENEVILKSRINLIFGSVLIFSTVFFFYKFIMDITQQIQTE